jgi:hypothetical protein
MRKEIFTVCVLDPSATGLRQLTVFCEHGTELLGP